MLSPGQRNHRVRFERRVPGADDGAGNVLPVGWTALVTCWAGFRPKFGRELIDAGRLEATTLGTMTVLSFSATRAVTAADRVVFVTGPYIGKECQIRSIVMTPDACELEFLLEAGVVP